MSARNFNVRLLSVAEQDLLDIIDYIAAENPSVALKVLDSIEKQLQELKRHPLLGRVPADASLARMGYRVLVVGDYLIFYKVQQKLALVYRIVHGSRAVVPLLEDL